MAYTFNVGLRRQRQVSLWVRGQPVPYAELQVSQGDMSPVLKETDELKFARETQERKIIMDF